MTTADYYSEFMQYAASAESAGDLRELSVTQRIEMINRQMDDGEVQEFDRFCRYVCSKLRKAGALR